MKEYVVVFAFDYEHENVLLVQKEKPEWQKGLLNGVGGKVEKNENPIDAAKREFFEETGQEIKDIKDISLVTFKDNRIHFFKTYLKDLNKFHEKKNDIDEYLYVLKIKKINEGKVIHNLKWLIPLALDDDIVHPVYCGNPL